MTQPTPPPSGSPEPEPEKTVADAPVGRGGRLARLTGPGRARWVALGVATVVVGGVAVAVAADHHGDHHHRPGLAAEGRWHHGKPDGGGPVVKDHEKDRLLRRHEGLPHAPGAGAVRGGAPVPLPELPAQQAAEKAAAAVPGGKTESLRPIPQQGGGTAWRAVVLGPDGTRHLVTLSGSDGTVTGNTPMGPGTMKAPSTKG